MSRLSLNFLKLLFNTPDMSEKIFRAATSDGEI